MAAKKRVFISFDFDNDKTLKVFLIGQSENPDSPFEVIDGSLKEEQPQKQWEERALTKIKAADVVIVMVGTQTYKAPGVLKEVKMANDSGKVIFQIKGYSDKQCPAVTNAGKYYNWNWDNLKKLLS